MIASLGFGYLVLLIWLVTPPPPVGFYWDDGWYLLMAEWFSGRSEHRELVWNMLHLRHYPPLYPAVLAVSGATLEQPEVGFLINALAGTGAAVGLMLWMRRSEGMSVLTAAAASAALILSPVALTWLPALFSEHLFVLLTVAALWLAAIARDPRDWVLLGIVAGLAIMTRSAGVALLCALAITMALTRWRMLPWLVLGLGPVLVGGWWIVSELPSIPRYRSALLEMVQNLWNAENLLTQTGSIAEGWRQLWGSFAGAVIALIAVLPGLWVRLRQLRADAWLVPVSLAMLMLWPFPEHMPRFMWPLMPALLVCAGETTRYFKQPVIRYAVLALVPAVVALGLQEGVIRSVNRASNPPDPSLKPLSRMSDWTRLENPTEAAEALQARRQLLLDMERVNRMTPPRVCIYAELPALVAVQAKRISLAAPWQNLPELLRHEINCDFYYLMPLGLPGASPEAIHEIAGQHEVLFRSPLPWDPSGPVPMGVLFKLKRN